MPLRLRHSTAILSRVLGAPFAVVAFVFSISAATFAQRVFGAKSIKLREFVFGILGNGTPYYRCNLMARERSRLGFHGAGCPYCTAQCAMLTLCNLCS